jgi:hypothetical protein
VVRSLVNLLTVRRRFKVGQVFVIASDDYRRGRSCIPRRLFDAFIRWRRISQRKPTARSTRIAEAEARGSTSLHILPFLGLDYRLPPDIVLTGKDARTVGSLSGDT